MVFATDSLVRGCHIYRDVWIAGIDSGSPESAIAKTSMPLHMQALIHQNSHGMLLIFVAGINFCRKEVTRNLFLKRKASSKYPKIIPFENNLLCSMF